MRESKGDQGRGLGLEEKPGEETAGIWKEHRLDFIKKKRGFT